MYSRNLSYHHPSQHIPDQLPAEPPPVIIDEYEEQEVNKILDSRVRYGKLQYLVDWTGQSINERTWEPAKHLNNAPQKVEEFHSSYPNRPSPNSIKNKTSLEDLTLMELRDKCRESGLVVRGSKTELLKRLGKSKQMGEELWEEGTVMVSSLSNYYVNRLVSNSYVIR